VYHNPELSAERAADYLAEGFTALMFDPAGPYTLQDPRQPRLEDIERSELFCKRLREAVGNQADLLFGTHSQFTTSGAIRLGQHLKPYNPLWFEEPLPPEMPEEMAKVAQAVRIQIATGERLTTKWEFSRVLRTGAAIIIQMAIGRVGGILEAKKIASMAEAYYAQVAPHLYCGPIEGAANIHLSATLPNFLILESIEQWGGFYGQILKTPIQWDAGYVLVPDTPGLGVELNEAVALANPYKGHELHLETTTAAVTA
jgi:2-dehydro-3-deoxyphosphogalactonate aldolase